MTLSRAVRVRLRVGGEGVLTRRRRRRVFVWAAHFSLEFLVDKATGYTILMFSISHEY